MSKEAFFKRRVHRVSSGGGIYYVRPLTGAQLEALLSLEGAETLQGVRASCLVCCFCACDENGVRVFSDDDLQSIRDDEDFDMVANIAKAAMEASGLGDDEPGKD